MKSLPHRSHAIPVADLSYHRRHLERDLRADQPQPPTGAEKRQPGIFQSGRGVALPFLFALGVSLMGRSTIAAQAPRAIAEPVVTSSSSIVSSLLAQGLSDSPAVAPARDSGEEAIQGDSEARRPTSGGSNMYNPIRLKSGSSVEDTLTTQDIPMGQGSFARDYVVTLKAQDQIAIDLFSESFDTVVMLMSENGTTLGENDDGPDGGTNSLLFMRIAEDGDYVVRVRGFGQAKGGPFKLKLTRLKAEP